MEHERFVRSADFISESRVSRIEGIASDDIVRTFIHLIVRLLTIGDENGGFNMILNDQLTFDEFIGNLRLATWKQREGHTLRIRSTVSYFASGSPTL
jgi:hypothetical protein